MVSAMLISLLAGCSNFQNLGSPAGVSIIFKYDPAVGVWADGRLSAFVVDTNGGVWQDVMSGANSSTWTGWSRVGTATASSPIQAANNADGSLVLLMDGCIGGTCGPMQNAQNGPNGGWLGWVYESSWGTAGTSHGIAGGVDASGYSERVMIASPGGDYDNFLNSYFNGSSWTSSTLIGNFVQYLSVLTRPIIAPNYNGNLSVFAVRRTPSTPNYGSIAMVQQNAPGNWGSSITVSNTGNLVNTVAAVRSPYDGLIWVTAIDIDHNVQYTHQTSHNSTTYSAMTTLLEGGLVDSPTLAVNGNNVIEGAAGEGWPDPAGNLELVYFQQASAGSTSWSIIGSWSDSDTYSSPVMAKNQNGRLSLFSIWNDGNVYHRWESAVGTWGACAMP